MQANPRSLDRLFNSQLRYVVPMFQRLYVWQENPQWSNLWEDIEEKAKLQINKEETSPHYLGALIIEGVRPSSPREVKRFLVIDGQQRLTTLQLLFCAFRDYARSQDWKGLDRSTSRYLENSDIDVMENPNEERFKLWPTTLNREIFRDIILAGSAKAVEDRYPLIRLRRKRKPEPRSALVEAYLYFSKKIEAWTTLTAETTGRGPEDCAFSLLQALQQDFSVVEISLAEGDDSQEIFYSLNSQGQPLSQSDLLRSLIFMRAEKDKLDRDEIFRDYWSKFETPFWSYETRRGGRSYSRLDLGLRYFLIGKTGQLVDARRVNEEYRRWIAVKPPRYASVREELADFSRFGDAYERYESSATAVREPTDLRRVLLDFDVSTVLPLILYLELNEEITADARRGSLTIIESFIARRIVVGGENKEYNKFFVEVIGTLRDAEPLDIQSALRSKLLGGVGTTRNWPSDEEVIEAVISRPLFSLLRTPALRLILERLELKRRGKKTESADIGAGLQIEHVLPQSWGPHWPLKGKHIPSTVVSFPWQADDDLKELADGIRHRNLLLQTLGNLTLVNGYLNPAASNGSFAMKLIEYKNSVLRLNRYFSDFAEWDEAAIVERSRRLGGEICEIWPRD